MAKNKIWMILLIAASLLVVSITGCTRQPSPPVPPITPVTPGYIQSGDHKLGYSFEYPEDWTVHSPFENIFWRFENPKKG